MENIKYTIGQRWYSQTEPELGLGIITELEDKYLSILFPLCQEARKYNANSHPLKRYKLEINDSTLDLSGNDQVVKDFQVKDNLYYYQLGSEIICETQLDAKIDLSGAKERLFSGNSDPLEYYRLRYETQLLKRKYQEFPYKHFLGPAIRLIPHQLYIADQVINMSKPKVMLCDEVGLGKTIEACLILHSLIRSEQVQNALIIVPESLTNQWFVELFKKFYLSFNVIDETTDLKDVQENTERVILSRKLLTANNEIQDFIQSKDWDILIIDEAHQLNFSNQNLVSFIEQINKKTYSTLMLSATPEIIGSDNLFKQLKLIDPDKFHSEKAIDQFLFPDSKIISALSELNQNIIPSNLNQLIDIKDDLTPSRAIEKIIDKYGPGRSFFRNSKSNLSNYTDLFKTRISHPNSIEVNEKNPSKNKIIEYKVFAFLELLKNLDEEKVLIITHSKKDVDLIKKYIINNSNLKISIFSSEQSLLERDRQAAYFADPEGAQILISTEIGSEGRNFEFSHHLALFDFPLSPDQMEQRIGRLDRIGQEKDINIHSFYIKDSFEEYLFRWYEEVLQLFTNSPIELTNFYSKAKEELTLLLEAPFNTDLCNKFINKKQKEYKAWCSKIKSQKNILFDLHSYHHKEAIKIVQQVEEFEKSHSFLNHLEFVSHVFGINYNDLNQDSINLTPSDNMLISSFPALPMEGFSYAITRDYAIKRDDLQLLSLEHPLYQGIFDLVLHSNFGNLTICLNENLNDNILFEFIFTLQCVDEVKHVSSQFLPLTPIRVLLNHSLQDYTLKFPMKNINNNCTRVPEHQLEGYFEKMPKDFLSNLIEMSSKLSLSKNNKYRKQALEKLESTKNEELNRAKDFQIDTEELEITFKQIQHSINNAAIELDSIRIIFPVQS